MGDRRRTARHGLVFLALAVLLFAAKSPVLSTPYLWDETVWIEMAHRVADGPLWAALPGFRPAREFHGRPFALFTTMAVVFRACGRSIWLSHAVSAAFAVLGAFFTYRLADLLYGPTAGVLAALFLVFDAMYFAQSGMFLADLPTAALGVTCVYLALAGRAMPYFFCAAYLLLVKETALTLILALSVHLALEQHRAGLRQMARTALQWGVPLVVIAVYYGAKRLITGSFFVVGFDLLDAGPREALARSWTVTRWIFLEQQRWAFTALVLAQLLRSRSWRARGEIRLFALIALATGYPFSVVYFLPRYLLPVAPYLFVAAAGALLALVPGRAARIAAAAAMLAFEIVRLDGGPRSGTREWSMGYLSVVRAHAEACAYLESAFPSGRILAPWPLSKYLQLPEMGYVTRPLDAIGLGALGSEHVDLVIVDSLAAQDRDAALGHVRANGLSLLRRFERDGVRCDVYGTGPRRAPVSDAPLARGAA